MTDLDGISFGSMSSVQVPIHLRKLGSQPPQALVDVQVGSKTVQLPIDSGCSFGCVDIAPSILQNLDFVYTGKTLTNWDAFGNQYESRQYVLSNVRIGSLMIHRVVGFEFAFKQNMPGVIALPFLRCFNVMIDYQNHTFGLYERPSLPECVKMPVWTRVALLPEDPGIVLPLKLLGHDRLFRFLLDTPSMFMDNDDCCYDVIRAESDLGKYLRQQAKTKNFLSKGETFERFEANGITSSEGCLFSTLDFLIGDLSWPPYDALLGYSFLSRNAVVIDFDANEIYVAPHKSDE